MQLKLEGAVTHNEELERLNSDLRRSNTELQRQLDKWQSLETKGGAEVETLRKQRIDLEVKVKRLETQLKTLAEEKDALIEKEKHRVQKVKANQAEWMVQLAVPVFDVQHTDYLEFLGSCSRERRGGR